MKSWNWQNTLVVVLVALTSNGVWLFVHSIRPPAPNGVESTKTTVTTPVVSPQKGSESGTKPSTSVEATKGSKILTIKLEPTFDVK